MLGAPGVGVGLGRRRALREAAAFTPADLFASGEDGVWLDVQDLTTMWTTTVGSSHPTVGGTVSVIEDKSGNGNTFDTATSTDRPTLRQTAGGLYYLEFSNNRLKGPSSWPVTSISDGVVCAGYQERVRQNSSLFNLGNNNSTARWGAHAPWSDGNVYFDTGGVTSPNRITGAMPVAVGTDVVGTFIGSVTDSEQLARINGTQIVGDASGHTVTAGGVANIGFDGTNYMAMNLYGFVAVVTRNLTAQEISDLESWMATKSGVTL